MIEIAGTKLFIPVRAPGAVFEATGEAGPGNGEVDIRAIESSLTEAKALYM